jgi:hypothetical protein
LPLTFQWIKKSESNWFVLEIEDEQDWTVPQVRQQIKEWLKIFGQDAPTVEVRAEKRFLLLLKPPGSASEMFGASILQSVVAGICRETQKESWTGFKIKYSSPAFLKWRTLYERRNAKFVRSVLKDAHSGNPPVHPIGVSECLLSRAQCGRRKVDVSGIWNTGLGHLPCVAAYIMCSSIGQCGIRFWTTPCTLYVRGVEICHEDDSDAGRFVITLSPACPKKKDLVTAINIVRLALNLFFPAT